MDRRRVVQSLGLASAGLLLSGWRMPAWGGSAYVDARGRVTIDGSPVEGVRVTDGKSVVVTDRDGIYELDTTSDCGFISVSLPGRVAVPVSEAGTAQFYRAVPPGRRMELLNNFDFKSLDREVDRHALLLMADPQVQDERDIGRMHAESIPAIRRTIEELAPRHVVGVAAGDIMYDNLQHFGAWERLLRETGLPGFQLVGNHDLDVASRTDADSTLPFQRRWGPTWYSFDRGDVHVVVLDDVFWWGSYMGYINRAQLDWLAADLRWVRPGRRVLVCVHIPTWSRHDERNSGSKPHANHMVANRELLYELLEPYNATILAGHMHELEILNDGPLDVHVCGALCGAWWTGNICGDGAPNGFMVYEIDGGDVSWRYQSVGESADHQMRLYRPGADPQRPQEVLANIWAADPSWEIVWYADGDRRGFMTPYRGLDPLARKLYSGPDVPEPRTWAEPYVTDHLYSCRPESTVREVTVEARDRWGRVFREQIDLT